MASKKTPVKEAERPRFLIKRTELTPVSSLSVYDKNPRIGNIDAIAESMAMGQYKAIVVNERDGKILAGNHTFLAARKLGWDEIWVSYVDVDEDEAKRIVLVDNKTADMGEYDDGLLAELLASIPTIEGTGYTAVEVDDLLSGFEDIEQSIASITDSIAQEERAEAELRNMGTFEGAPLGEEPDPRDSERGILPELPPSGPTVENQPDYLPGAMGFKPPDAMDFDGVGPWGVTRLRDDMLMTFDEIPDNLDSWAGSATKDWPDDEQWWLYNWGIDSTSGMKDISKVIVAFYAYDNYFENWWGYPERYAAKLVNSKIKYMVTPDWSMELDMPPLEWLWQLNKSRLIGRYMQECGIKVIPNIGWPFGKIDFLRDHILATLPTNVPCIAIQMQGAGSTLDDEEETEQAVTMMNQVFSQVEPEGALIYASKTGIELLNMCDTRSTRIKIVGTRMEKLADQAKGRTKKTTI